MKKTSALLILLASVIGSISLASSAMAADPIETVELGVDLSVSKCTLQQGGLSTCETSASSPSNIAIELKTCSSSQGSTYCYGNWENTITRDGHSFTSRVTASKWSYAAGVPASTFYTVYASVGIKDSRDARPIQIKLSRAGAITDSIYFYGSQLTVPGSGDTYTPSLGIAPKNPALAQD